MFRKRRRFNKKKRFFKRRGFRLGKRMRGGWDRKYSLKCEVNRNWVVDPTPTFNGPSIAISWEPYGLADNQNYIDLANNTEFTNFRNSFEFYKVVGLSVKIELPYVTMASEYNAGAYQEVMRYNIRSATIP